jgi:K+-sensing histidine kinase KdpD
MAFGGDPLIERFHLRNITLFLCAIAVVAWYGGAGAAVLAPLLSCIGFAYFFAEPSHTLYISRSTISYFILFVFIHIARHVVNAVRRRVERELLQSRDELEVNKEPGAFWAVINEPPPGSVRK